MAFDFTTGPPRLTRPIDRRLQDPQHRAMLFRGVSLGPRARHPPYFPIYPPERADLDADVAREEIDGAAPQLDRLQAAGFNLVRLVLPWAGFGADPDQPAPDAWVAATRHLLDALHAREMAVVMAFHQDLFHDGFGGAGFPDWAVDDDLRQPLPVESLSRWPRGTVSLVRRDTGVDIGPGVRGAWQALYQGAFVRGSGVRRPVLTQLALCAARVAARLREHPAILAWEPLVGAPAAGTPAAEVDTAIRSVFETMATFMRAALPEPDPESPPDLTFIVSPRVDWTCRFDSAEEGVLSFVDSPTTTVSVPPIPQRLLGLPWMDPDLPPLAEPGTVDPDERGPRWAAQLAAMVSEAERLGLVPFVNWFSVDQREALPVRGDRRRERIQDGFFHAIEQARVSAALWSADLYNTEAQADAFHGDDTSIFRPGRVFASSVSLERPYPAACSARLSSYAYDPDSRRFVVEQSGVSRNVPTLVAVPDLPWAETGFDVWATGELVGYDPVRRRLAWILGNGPGPHALAVVPRGAPPELAGRPSIPSGVAAARLLSVSQPGKATP